LAPDAPPPGRVELIAELTSRIAEGGSWVLLGPRRSGKTSILRYLEVALRYRHSVRFLDLQGYPCSTPDVFAASLIPALLNHEQPAAELVKLLTREERPVILLDELGRLANVDTEKDPNVFEWLRSLGQSGVALVLAGTPRDWDLVQTRDAKKPGSSFANIMKAANLGPLPNQQAIAFLANTAPDDVPIRTSDVGRWIVEFVGGWPFYLQVLAHAFVEDQRGRPNRRRPVRGDIHRLYERTLLREYEFVFRQRWRELGERTQRVILRGTQGQLPSRSTLSPSDVDHLERQGLYDSRLGWTLAQDKPFLEWLGSHLENLIPENEGGT
jgi:hypothetical protein